MYGNCTQSRILYGNVVVFFIYVVMRFSWYVCYVIDVMAPVILDWRLVCSYGHLFLKIFETTQVM